MYSIVPPLFLRLFFLSLIPPPPRSTLFPYTTLFRSTSEPGETICRRCPGAHLACVLLDREAVVRSHTPLEHSEKRGPELKDRKSTRLNSSHVSISYAVFCLKKKKKKKNKPKDQKQCQ